MNNNEVLGIRPKNSVRLSLGDGHGGGEGGCEGGGWFG